MFADTIVALASAPGSSERAVLRLSGPQARQAAALSFVGELPLHRAQIEGSVRIRGALVPALALVFCAPASFTGEDTVELHVPGGALFVQLLQEELLLHGAPLGLRRALPGEFTARACQNGRLDLLQAEGVWLLLHAADQREAASAVQWLRGGLSRAVVDVRHRLQDALARCEVALDFTEDETGVLAQADWIVDLEPIEARLDELLANLPVAAPGGEVMLLGAANAGKSSLANALAGRPVALVDTGPGTTRDLLRIEIAAGVAVWDAPGDLAAPAEWDAAAIALRDRLAGRAAAALAVIDAARPNIPDSFARSRLPWLAVVWTHADLVAAPPPLPPEFLLQLPAGLPMLVTSALTGEGIAICRELLVARAAAGGAGAGAPLRDALRQVRLAVDRARSAASMGAELAAHELQRALVALDDVDGKHSPENLLDRIYARFCLGK